jgi:hypothetical protein
MTALIIPATKPPVRPNPIRGNDALPLYTLLFLDSPLFPMREGLVEDE